MSLLQEIGLTQEEIQDRVIERIAEKSLSHMVMDDEGFDCEVGSSLSRALDKKIKDTINAAVESYGDKHVKPKIVEHIETLVIEKTNSYGEKKGEPITFLEYLIERAEVYMLEAVDMNGKGSGHPHRYKSDTTRIAYMIDQHLRYEIEGMVKKVMADANSKIAEGLQAAVKMKLNEVKVLLDVKTK